MRSLQGDRGKTLWKTRAALELWTVLESEPWQFEGSCLEEYAPIPRAIRMILYGTRPSVKGATSSRFA